MPIWFGECASVMLPRFYGLHSDDLVVYRALHDVMLAVNESFASVVKSVARRLDHPFFSQVGRSFVFDGEYHEGLNL